MGQWTVLGSFLIAICLYLGWMVECNSILRVQRHMKKPPCPKVDFSRNELSCPNPALTGCPRNYPYGDPVPCMTDLECPCSAICCNFGKRCPQQCWMNTTLPQQADLQSLQSNNQMSTFSNIGGESGTSGVPLSTKTTINPSGLTPMLIVLPVWTTVDTGQFLPMFNVLSTRGKNGKGKDQTGEETDDLSNFLTKKPTVNKRSTNEKDPSQDNQEEYQGEDFNFLKDLLKEELFDEQ